MNLPRKLRAIAIDWWVWEWVSLVVSLAALLGIFCVLAVSNSTAHADWSLPIGINTVIAILSTISQTTLLVAVSAGLGQLKWRFFAAGDRPLSHFQKLDEASRGPFGSVRLLLTFKWLHLFSLGACITILCLAMDPFAQNVIAIAPITVAEHTATIARATVANFLETPRGFIDWSSKGPHGRYWNSGVIMPIRAAIYNGILTKPSLRPSSTFDPSWTCPTSNCTWDDWSTLGVCSKCTDIGDDTKIVWASGTDGTNHVTLPNGFKVPFQDGHRGTLFATQSVGALNDLDSIAYGDFLWPLLDFVVVQVSNDSTAANVEWWASECVLYFCGQLMRSTLTAGKLDEKRLATTMNQTELAAFIVRGSYYSEARRVRDYIDVPDPLSNTPFKVDPHFSIQLQYILENTFVGSVNISDGITVTSDFVDALWVNQRDQRYDSLDVLVRQVATSITSTFRDYSNQTYFQVGLAHKSVPYIHVRWQYMTLPSILVLTSFVFLTCTFLLNSGRTRMRIWKNSALAMVLHGCDETIQKEANKSRVIDMEDLARRTNVQLTPHENGWNLRRTSYQGPVKINTDPTDWDNEELLKLNPLAK